MITQSKPRGKEQALGCLSCLTTHRSVQIDAVGLGLLPWLTDSLYSDKDSTRELSVLNLLNIVRNKELVDAALLENGYEATMFLISTSRSEPCRLYGGRVVKRLLLRHKLWKGIRGKTAGPAEVAGRPALEDERAQRL